MLRLLTDRHSRLGSHLSARRHEDIPTDPSPRIRCPLRPFAPRLSGELQLLKSCERSWERQTHQPDAGEGNFGRFQVQSLDLRLYAQRRVMMGELGA